MKFETFQFLVILNIHMLKEFQTFWKSLYFSIFPYFFWNSSNFKYFINLVHFIYFKYFRCFVPTRRNAGFTEWAPYYNLPYVGHGQCSDWKLESSNRFGHLRVCRQTSCLTSGSSVVRVFSVPALWPRFDSWHDGLTL